MAGPGDMIYARVGPLVEMQLFKKISIGICIIQIITTEECKIALIIYLIGRLKANYREKFRGGSKILHKF